MGRLGVLLTVSTIMLAWGAVVIRLARAHIDRRIEKTLECVVKDAVKTEVEPLRIQINNGLTHRTTRIEDKVDLLITTLITDVLRKEPLNDAS